MIRLEKLSVGHGDRTLIDAADLTLEGGRLVALIGRNGTGKSSLLRVIGGIDRPLGCGVSFDGNDIHAMSPLERARTIAFVTTQRVRIANLRCRDVVGMGRTPYTDWIGRMTESDREIVADALRLVDMTAYADRARDTLSDGECQRIMTARALAQQTPVILLDEPTAFLDIPARHATCRLLQRLAHEERKRVLFSTHELDLALELADDILLIDSTRLVLDATDSSSLRERIFQCFELG